MIYISRVKITGIVVVVLIAGMIIGSLGFEIAAMIITPILLFWWMLYDEVTYLHRNERRNEKEVQDESIIN